MMETSSFERKSEFEWVYASLDGMHVPVVIFASEELLRGMDGKVREQAVNVARLPGIQVASFAMPDAHWGYGFPIGGVAAFDADEEGVVSAGGVGFDTYGLHRGDIIVSIHCGSRGLGHQIGTEFLKKMLVAAASHGLVLPERELACAPIRSPIGRQYLGAMRAGINCALANRQLLTHLTRQAFATVLPGADLTLLYDVSHNTCKVETHEVRGERKPLYVHRKGATRAFGPGHPEIPEAWRQAGQPVLIGGSMGTCSYILAGTAESEGLAFSSAVHGAGRAMSRHQATHRWQGREIVHELAGRGIAIRCRSMRGVAEEAPLAYKDVSAVVDAADRAGLARKVVQLVPVICVKG